MFMLTRSLAGLIGPARGELAPIVVGGCDPELVAPLARRPFCYSFIEIYDDKRSGLSRESWAGGELEAVADKTKSSGKSPARRLQRRLAGRRSPRRQVTKVDLASIKSSPTPATRPPGRFWAHPWLRLTRAWRRWWRQRQLAWEAKTSGSGDGWWRRWQQHRRRQRLLDNLQQPDRFWRRFFWRLHPRRLVAFWFSWRGLWLLAKIGLVGLVVSLIVGFIVYRHFSQGLPTTTASLQSCLQGRTTRYYDRTGQTLLWASKSDVDCRPINSLDEASPHLVAAVLAAEDQDFYSHRGFHLGSIVRAAINNFRGKSTQGGSTITQQYVKNAVLGERERSVSRKIRELILSLELEQQFTKDEILTAYLNTISFGSIYDGISSASWGYFGKAPAGLSLEESALLVAAVPAPSYYWSNPDDHRARQAAVLGLMLEQGRISSEEYQAAMAVDIWSKVNRSRNQYADIQAPHFVLEAEKRLQQEYGQDIRLAGLRVITTLDLEAQALAEAAVAKTIPSLEKRNFDNAAAVAVEVETGKVIAQVGSRDFNYPEFGQINTATTLRDPGSVFKIFNYSTLIETTTDWGAGSTLYDYQTVFTRPLGRRSGYKPRNYNNQFNGPVTLRQAFGRSLNIPAIKAMYIAGKNNVHQFAQAAGLETPPDCGGYCGLSTAIGGGAGVRLDEVTNAYATFGRMGEHLPLTYIDQIYDHDSQRLYKWRPERQRVVSEQTAYIINDILSDTSARFSQRFNLKNATAAVKTGTTDDFKNNLIVGYSQKVAFGAWMGHHDITKSFGESFTTEPKSIIFREFMEAYHANLPVAETARWPAPAGIKRVRVNLQTGYAVAPGADLDGVTSSRVDIYPSWYEPVYSPPAEQLIVIDKITSKLATDCTPLGARQYSQGGGIRPEILETDPFYLNWLDPIAEALEVTVIRGQTDAVDDLHQCDDILPQIELTGPDFCQASCLLTATIIGGTHPLSSVEFFLDDLLLEGSQFILDGSVATINFQFEPTVNSDLVEVVVEVIDAALYSTTATIQLATQVAGSGLYLEPVLVNATAQIIEVSWNQPLAGLELYFARACLGAEPVALAAADTSQIISITGLEPGLCQVEIRTLDGRVTNNRSFWVYPPDFIGIGI